LNYILDACALIALFKREAGWDVVNALFKRARVSEINLGMSINLLEVIYGFRRDKDITYAVELLKKVYSSPISIIDTIHGNNFCTSLSSIGYSYLLFIIYL
jgi:hypothetical protein